MKSLEKIAALVCLTLTLSATQAQERVTGLFKISVESKVKDIPNQVTLVALDKTDDGVFAVNLVSPNTYLVGKNREDYFEIPFAVKTSEGGLVEMRLLADAKDKKINIRSTSKDLWFKATAVSTGWYCGNHKAAHLAFTVEDVAYCTKTFGCKGWRQVNAIDVAEFIKSKKDSKDKENKKVDKNN